jgi:hypothetical protein
MKQIRLKNGITIVSSCDTCPMFFEKCSYNANILRAVNNIAKDCPLEEYVMKEIPA